MQTHITNWGNSLGMRIPKHIAEVMGLKNGSKLDIGLKGDKLIIQPVSAHQEAMGLANDFNLDEMMKKITPKNTHHLSDFDDENPIGDEVW